MKSKKYPKGIKKINDQLDKLTIDSLMEIMFNINIVLKTLQLDRDYSKLSEYEMSRFYHAYEKINKLNNVLLTESHLIMQQEFLQEIIKGKYNEYNISLYDYKK